MMILIVNVIERAIRRFGHHGKSEIEQMSRPNEPSDEAEL
jgi:hypothetical protein